MADLSHLATWVFRNLLLPVTCCFILGATLTLPVSTLSPQIVLPAIIGTLILSLIGCRIIGPNPTLLLLFFFILGFFHTRQALQPPKDPSHIYNLVQKKTYLTLDGTITNMVSQGGDKSRFVLKLTKIIYRDKPGSGRIHRATGKIRLSMRGRTPPFVLPGQRVLVVATVDRIHNHLTPGTFDYVLYMRNQGIYCSGWIKSARFILKGASENNNNGLRGIITLPQKVRQHISHFLQNRCDPVSGGLYQALLIGDRSNVSPAILDQFVRTGCMHLLAISGLHMGLLALLIYGLLSRLMKRSQWLLLHTNITTLALSLSFPVLLGYAFIAGMNTPVFRSLIMAAVLLVAVLVRRQHSIFHLVAAAALVVLAARPLALFTVSFQLSFAAMLAIALIYPRLLSFCFQETSNSTNKKTSALIRWPLTAFLVSLAATGGTLPFLLYHFNRFSPIGPFMNLLIEPLLCFIALPIGLIAIPLIAIVPDAAAGLFNLGGAALHAADFLTAWAAQLPGATLWTITPTPVEIILFYLLLIFSCTTNIGKRKNQLFLILAFFLLALNFTCGPYPQKKEKNARVSYLDVGRGTATLLELPGGTTILIDGGGSSSKRFNVGKQIIAPYLWKNRIRHIDTVIITHPDSDHYNGLYFILQRFRPRVVYTNGQQVESNSYNALMQLIKRMKIKKIQSGTGRILYDGPLCRLACLGMPGLADRNDSDNNQSLVNRLSCGSTSFLFPADIEKKAESLLLGQENTSLRANVLLAPHHGSKTSSTRSFIQSVDPDLIIVSAGRRQRNLFPASAHLKQWQQDNIPFLITGIDGTIICKTDGKAITTTYAGQENP